MFFSASAAWYDGRYVAPSGSPSPSKSAQNVAVAGHAPVGVPAAVLDVVLVVVGVPVLLLVVVLVVVVLLPVVVLLLAPPPALLLLATGLPVPELTLEAPPVPAPAPPAPPASEPPFPSSEHPAAAADRARQEIPTHVKRAMSRCKEEVMSMPER
ncbi:hypothetical protein [Sorangium sp. So ce385]|uniref:hypothetical protein n=1 Tax=Sorangium sp. So ce385 TaxID=3133308 RepID=UPI003F5AFC88